MEELNKDLFCFEVETIYKSGYKRTEVIISGNEESMWKYYDKHHNRSLISESAITDAWIS